MKLITVLAILAVILAAGAFWGSGAFDKLISKTESVCFETSSVQEKSPSVIAEAEKKEAERQDKTWTNENIQKNPALYLRAQISECDKLKAQLEAQYIGVNKYKNQALRRKSEAEESLGEIKSFLELAKNAYREAASRNVWPVSVNGYDFSQEVLGERIVEAADRIPVLEKRISTEKTIIKRTEVQIAEIRKKEREVVHLKRNLEEQAESVKTAKAIEGVDGINDTLNSIRDMVAGLTPDPQVVGLDDAVKPDGLEKNKAKLEAILAE